MVYSRLGAWVINLFGDLQLNGLKVCFGYSFQSLVILRESEISTLKIGIKEKVGHFSLAALKFDPGGQALK